LGIQDKAFKGVVPTFQRTTWKRLGPHHHVDMAWGAGVVCTIPWRIV